jgi:hypothetical protein
VIANGYQPSVSLSSMEIWRSSMAGSESCIYHPERDQFLIIRRHYVEMFGGDVDLAALLALFEFWTNGELDQFAKRREQGIPWVTVAMPVIEHWMMNICGRRKIQDKLALLDKWGLLRSNTPGCQTSKSYLLNIDGLNQLVHSGVKVDESFIGNFADGDAAITGSSKEVIGKSADQSQEVSKEVIGKNDRAYAFSADQNDDVSLLCLKKEEKKEEEEHNSPSLVPSEPENQSQNPDVPPAAGRPMLDGDETQESARPGKRSWKRPKPERPHGFSDRMRQLREGAHNQAADGVERLMTPSRVVTSAPETPIAPGASYAQEETFPVRWNRLVPARPVDAGLLAPNPKAYREQVFAQRFDEICQKASALIAAGADVQFGFLLSTDRGTEQYRWQQLLAGQLDWMKPRANGSVKEVKKPVDGVAIAAQMRKERLEREAKERAAEVNQDTH